MLDHEERLAWVRGWAAAGERQRVVERVPAEFTVFGTEAVIAGPVWGRPVSSAVLLRMPLLVAAFTAVFDDAWRSGLPVPDEGLEQDAETRLLALLGTGFKDEAIARYLGLGLRTVRRRVAVLMDEHGVHTRFQAGCGGRAPRAAAPPLRLAGSRVAVSGRARGFDSLGPRRRTAPPAPSPEEVQRARSRADRRPVGRRGQGQGDRRPRPPRRPRREVQRRQQRRAHRRDRRREVRAAPAAVGHPHAGLHAGHRQRRGHRPGGAVRGASRACRRAASTPRGSSSARTPTSSRRTTACSTR
ncbi:hypothetical protein GCM10025868_26050 [Angustibacter aerolatus]|uniref:HTH luxR-type domain-containing protein n=1 Tax=Angustibacter aerolatus TaxID=1162965 RepID=A0ABQ6JKP1_9ACTN|nr:hypothetical protein GCM10025868_26050 [Angustibacter aerolatus]